jgi:Tfp pilus assembly protein PilO
MTKSRLWLMATAVAVVAILVGGWFALVAPRNADAASLRTQASEALKQVDAIRSELTELKAVQAALPAKQAELADLEARIPAPDPALPSMIRSLTQAATAANVRLISIDPASPTPLPATQAGAGPLISSILVTLKIVGGYSDVTRYINLLEKQKRAMLVSNFTVTGASPAAVASATPAPTDIGPGEVGLDLGLTIFVSTAVPLPAPQAAATTPPTTPIKK